MLKEERKFKRGHRPKLKDKLRELKDQDNIEVVLPFEPEGKILADHYGDEAIRYHMIMAEHINTLLESIIGNNETPTQEQIIQLKETVEIMGFILPVGAIIPYLKDVNNSSPDLPAGFLVCDGSMVKEQDHPDLFTMIGTKYGSGTADGKPTFGLPNLNDRFLRGKGSLSAGVGDTQEDAFQGHGHRYEEPQENVADYSKGTLKATYGQNKNIDYRITTPVKLNNTFGDVRYDSETRPKNMTVIYLIKSKDDDIKVLAKNTEKIGEIKQIVDSELPDDTWLMCNGAKYKKSDYPYLYNTVGDTYNIDGTPTDEFCVPDYRDMFLRGLKDGRTFNDKQEASVVYGGGINGRNPVDGKGVHWYDDNVTMIGNFAHGGYAGVEYNITDNYRKIRPDNYPVNFIIKAKPNPVAALMIDAPIGKIEATMYPEDIPANCLVCDGRNVSRTDYVDLFNAIGVTYGMGDGINTFAVPDLRDQFLRGKSDSRNLGEAQEDDFRSHTHTLNNFQHNGSMWLGGNHQPTIGMYLWNSSTDVTSTGGSETRPKNLPVVYYIVAKSASNTSAAVMLPGLRDDLMNNEFNTINGKITTLETSDFIYQLDVGVYSTQGWINSVFTEHNTGGNTISLATFKFSGRRPKVGDLIHVRGNWLEVTYAAENATELRLEAHHNESVFATWLRDTIANGRKLLVCRTTDI